MQVPSLVGSQTGVAPTGGTVPAGFSLIAEDGNPLPGVLRVQSEVFMAAGKTYDVMINVPAAGVSALPSFDRQLSLSGNATGRDAGMLAYIGINGAGLPAASTSGSGVFAAAKANADSYLVVPGKQLSVSDVSKGVVANDVNIYGVGPSVPTAGHGTVALNTNGTFTYAADSTWTPTCTDSFTYCGNGVLSATPLPAACAVVTLSGAPIEAAGGIVMNPITYTSNVATSLSIKSPGVLSVDKDNAGYPLTVVTTSVSNVAGPGALTLSMDKTGAFNASVTAPGTYTFTYMAQNSQGTVSGSTATVTLIFLTPTNLVVKVLDGKDKATVITDYRWIIEEDRTFYVNPNCTTTSSTLIAGCPTP